LETFERVAIRHIQPDPEQDRKHFDSVKLQELADSIGRQGLLEPLIIEPAAGGYRIIAGERRFRACQIAGLLEVPCLIREGLSESDRLAVQLAENTARENLRPTEEAAGYQKRLNMGRALADVAAEAGRSSDHVRRRLSLLRLLPEVALLVDTGHIPITYGEVIADLPLDHQAAAARESAGCRDTQEFRERCAKWLPSEQGGMFEGDFWQAQADRVAEVRDSGAGKRLRQGLENGLQDLGRQLEKLHDPMLPVVISERRGLVKDKLLLAKGVIEDLVALIDKSYELEARCGDEWQGVYLDLLESRLRGVVEQVEEAC
jgi:ParB/RepB/Spo0J family partition protein